MLTRLWYIIILTALTLPLRAQSTDNYRKVTDLLSEWETKYNVSFAYNYGLFEGLTVPVSATNCDKLKECLGLLQSVLPVEVKSSSSSRYSLLPIRATAMVKIVDGSDGNLLDLITVGINDQDGTIILPTNDHFEIKGLFPTDSVLLQSRFYLPAKVSAQDLLKSRSTIKLKADTIYLEEVVIEDYISKGISANMSDQGMKVKMNALGPLAGDTDSDILTVLGTLPGVRTPSGKPGGVNFRGTTFDQTMIYFDDIPIYHTGHFFGTISPYNTLVVDEIDIYRGTLPARWGGRLGGLIDISTFDGVPQRTSGSISLNTVYAGGSVSIPIVKDKWGLSIASRTNYPIDGLSPKLEALYNQNFTGTRIINSQTNPRTNVIDELHFGDINGKTVYQVNDRNRVSLSGIYIDNGYSYDWMSDRGDLETENLELDNWGLTAKWNSQLTDKVNLNLGMSTSSLDVVDSGHAQTENGTSDRRVTNGLDEHRVFLDLTHIPGNKNEWSYGYSLTRQRVIFDEQGIRNDRPPGQRITAFTHSGYVSLKRFWSNRLITNIGIHSDYYVPLSNWVFDPRLSISYVLTDHLFLKASASQTHQYIRQVWEDDFNDLRISNEFWSVAAERIPIMQGRKAMVGASLERGRWLLDIEGYISKADGVGYRTQGVALDQGNLDTKGLDIMLKRRSNLVEFWVSYTLSQAKTYFPDEELAFYDQPHLFNIMSILTLDRWNFSLSWALMSGMPVRVPTLSPDNPYAMGQTQLNIPYADRFPVMHQMDMSASYKILKSKNGYMGTIGLSILNLYDQENIINIIQTDTNPRTPYRFAVGFAPNLNLSLRF